MFLKWLRFIVLLVITGALYYVCQVGITGLETPLPPFGKLMNPFTGFWQNNSQSSKFDETISSSKLKENVTVHWDDRMVPHIFAHNDYDLYFTQGYVTAKNRLWQMDFLSRVSGGRLAEVVGSKAIDFDRFHRRIGLLNAATESLDSLKNYPKEYQALVAYSEGVNEFITELEHSTYPVEFKLMNYQPEEWTPLKSLLIMKYMAWDLDGGTVDKIITNAKSVIPDSLFNILYPLENPFYEPIVGNSSSKTISSSSNRPYTYREPSVTGTVKLDDLFLPTSITNADPDYKKGSNNWVIDASKSRSGNPILANDPHLSLSLPSLWFENQLVSDSLNVYGVSLPGVPMVVIGFNKDVAWGLTYTTSDPIDFARVEVNDDNTEYKLDDKWAVLRQRTDTIHVLSNQPIVEQTLITAVGPIIYTDSIARASYNEFIPDVNVAMNWTAQQPTLEMRTMYLLNRAKTFEDYKAALPYFISPGQNFVFASNQNDIAIWHNGKFPIRGEQQARYLADTITSDLIWNDYIPFEELPHVINPNSGYIASANQSPVKGDYPYYLGVDDYATFERTNRINEVLDSLDSITPYDFQKLQLDNYSLLAEMLLPTLLNNLADSTLTTHQMDALEELKHWDYEYSAVSKSPTIFNEWVSMLQTNIFADEASESNVNWMLPRIDVMAELILNQSNLSIYDNKATEEVETLQDMILTSYQSAIENISEKHGSLNDSWNWGLHNPTTIKSLANIPGFGTDILMTGGSKRSVNAISGTHGPSWRMIVEVGEERPNAYGIYPGGQCGNPGSTHYYDFVEDWANGNYYQLNFLLSENELEEIVETTKFISE